MFSNLDKYKTKTMSSIVTDINPEVRLKTWNSFIDETNVDEFLKNIDVLIDSVDAFAIDTRRLIFNKAQAKGIPIVTCAPIGFGVSALIFTPKSMSFDSYFNYKKNLSELDKFSHFIACLCPKLYFKKYLDLTEVNENQQKGPSVASSVTLCAGYAGTQVVKLLTNKKVKATPYYHYFCPYTYRFGVKKLRFGNKHPFQKFKIKKFSQHINK